MPPDVPARNPRHLAAEAAHYSDVLDPPALHHSLVGGLFHGYLLPTTVKPVSRDQQLCPTIVQPRSDRATAVPRKDRNVYSADLGHRQQGDNRLRYHRHEHAHTVTLPHPQRL